MERNVFALFVPLVFCGFFVCVCFMIICYRMYINHRSTRCVRLWRTKGITWRSCRPPTYPCGNTSSSIAPAASTRWARRRSVRPHFNVWTMSFIMGLFFTVEQCPSMDESRRMHFSAVSFRVAERFDGWCCGWLCVDCLVSPPRIMKSWGLMVGFSQAVGQLIWCFRDLNSVSSPCKQSRPVTSNHDIFSREFIAPTDRFEYLEHSRRNFGGDMFEF